MQIILKENIVGLGFKDDVVNVKDGYARNYLIPQQKAIIANASSLRALKEELKQRANKIAKLRQAADAEAEKINALKPIEIEARVSADGKIYGSVNAAQIAEAVAKQGYELDKKIIVVKGVKVVGEHTAEIHLHKDVIVELPFTVIPEGAKVAKKETAEATAEEAPKATPEA